jgi:hypothetical protein
MIWVVLFCPGISCLDVDTFGVNGHDLVTIVTVWRREFLKARKRSKMRVFCRCIISTIILRQIHTRDSFEVFCWAEITVLICLKELVSSCAERKGRKVWFRPTPTVVSFARKLSVVRMAVAFRLLRIRWSWWNCELEAMLDAVMEYLAHRFVSFVVV